jgi:transcriptional regulatory protein RtcR
VALAMQEDFRVDRYHLIYSARFARLAEEVLADVAAVSPETERVPEVIEFADAWDFEEVYGKLYDFARRLAPKEGEVYYVHITTGTHVEQICLFLLTESRHFPGKLLQTSPPKGRGAAGTYAVIDLDLSRYDQLASRFRAERREGLDFLKSGIATRSAAFNRLIETIEKVAVRSSEPLLLTGPTGAGKSQLARRIYELKRQHRQVTGRFVEVNCATLRGDGAMSALFGHVKGAFTGAVAARAGLLKEADGGILFLDEVGELARTSRRCCCGPWRRACFCRSARTVRRPAPFSSSAAPIATCGARCGAARSARDLLARIDLWTFRLPGLAERREDIAPNLDYELEQYGRRRGARVTFSREARERFLAFAVSGEAAWSANFRDLNAAMTRMATLAPGGRIDAATVEEECRGSGRLGCRGARRALTARCFRASWAPTVGSASTASTSCSWPRSCRSAARRRACPRRGAGCLPFRGRKKPRRTMPTACGSTSPALGSRGPRWPSTAPAQMRYSWGGLSCSGR